MTYRAAGASKPGLRYVNSATFYIGATDVILKVNQTQLVGRYPTYDAAQLALEGILIRNGVKDTALALVRLPIEFKYLSTFVLTPAPAVNWANFSLDPTPSYGSSSQRVQAVTAPIKIRFTMDNLLMPLYVKVTSAVSPVNSNISPQNDGYTRVLNGQEIIVQPSFFVRLKSDADMAGTTALSTTVTATNVATNTVLDTLIVDYIPPV